MFAVNSSSPEEQSRKSKSEREDLIPLAVAL
jgi:hypothetical protein